MQYNKKFTEKRARLNHQIRVPQLMVIDHDGTKLGILSLSEAMRLAQERSMDLVEVGPNAQPPIAKIMDYGKYLYQKEKKEREAKGTKPKGQEVKTIQVGFKTSEHDLAVRSGQIDKFLQKGYRVKIDLRLRGRERGMKDLGRKKVEEFLGYITQPYAFESEIKSSPNGFTVSIKPDIHHKPHKEISDITTPNHAQ